MAVKVIFVPRVIDTERMSLLGQRGAAALHAKYDGKELTANARAAFDEKFLCLVDPQRKLSEVERTEQVRQARREYFTRLSRQAAAVRRARKAATETTVA